MQCRRVLLQRSGDVVTGYIEAAGEYISEESAFAEQMTFWRKKAKDKETIEFYPKLHDKSRQMWRDLSALLGTADNELKPGVVSWITMLQSKKLLPRGRFVAFETVGVEYGNMCCGVADEFSDTLDIHASLLDEIGRTWQIYILNEIERCDKLANAVGLLGLRIDRAAGGDGKSAEEQAKEQAYYRLDVPFRQWLMQVDPEQDAEEQSLIRMKWRNTAVEIIKKLGRELVDKAGSNAIAGRNVTEKIKNNETKMIHYSVPEAFNLFLYQISQIDK
jgi:CRISPR system Cascade subunit CasA